MGKRRASGVDRGRQQVVWLLVLDPAKHGLKGSTCLMKQHWLGLWGVATRVSRWPIGGRNYSQLDTYRDTTAESARSLLSRFSQPLNHRLEDIMALAHVHLYTT